MIMKRDKNFKYSDIINLPHHVSPTREQMPMSDRAAQFSPFAALTGYDCAIKETGRLTGKKIKLDEEVLASLNVKIQTLLGRLKEQPEVTVTYFKADEKKDGGSYLTITGIIKKVDDIERVILMKNGFKIPMDDVFNIESNLFSVKIGGQDSER